MEFCADSKAGYDRNTPYNTKYKKEYTDKEIQDKTDKFYDDILADVKKDFPWLYED